jgi:hypothetical protein
VYSWYIKGDCVKEKFLFFELLTTAACGEDVFRILQNFFIDKDL